MEIDNVHRDLRGGCQISSGKEWQGVSMEAVEIASWLCGGDTVNRCLILLEQGFN